MLASILLDCVYGVQALPLIIAAEEPHQDTQSAIWRKGDFVCVKLQSRKNMQSGSGVLRRSLAHEAPPSHVRLYVSGAAPAAVAK